MPHSEGRYSATQVAIFRDCRRKWAFRYLDGIEGEQNAYAELGSAIHRHLARYLDTGKLPGGQQIEVSVETPEGRTIEYTGDDILQIILPGIGHLPPPKTADVELEFILDIGELGGIVGYIDVVNGSTVIDHKTTSDLRWALSTEDLKKDPQAVIYGVYAMERTGADSALCRWVYYRRDPKRPGVKVSEARINLTETDKLWQKILEDVEAMAALRGKKAAEVEYSAEACDKYGGCPYRTVCGLTPMDRMRSLTTMLNLKERMKARQAAPAETEGAGQAVNPPEGLTALQRLKARQAQAPATTAEAPVKAAAPAPVKAAVPAKAAKAKGFTLYIGCAPNKECTLFSAIAAKVGDTIKAEKGCHYRLIEGLYGGNASIFAEGVGLYLDLYPQGDIVMDLASQEARDALEVVSQRAALVVRGF